MSCLLRQEDPQGFGSQAVNPAILPVGVGAVTMGSAVWGPRLWSRVCGWEEARPEAGGLGTRLREAGRGASGEQRQFGGTTQRPRLQTQRIP